jgi:hypothetical protein
MADYALWLFPRAVPLRAFYEEDYGGVRGDTAVTCDINVKLTSFLYLACFSACDQPSQLTCSFGSLENE